MIGRLFLAHDAERRGELSLFDSVPVDAFPIGARVARDALSFSDRQFTRHLLVGWKASSLAAAPPAASKLAPTIGIKKIEVRDVRGIRRVELGFASAHDRKTYLDFCEAEERRVAPLWSDVFPELPEDQ